MNPPTSRVLHEDRHGAYFFYGGQRFNLSETSRRGLKFKGGRVYLGNAEARFHAMARGRNRRGVRRLRLPPAKPKRKRMTEARAMAWLEEYEPAVRRAFYPMRVPPQRAMARRWGREREQKAAIRSALSSFVRARPPGYMSDAAYREQERLIRMWNPRLRNPDWEGGGYDARFDPPRGPPVRTYLDDYSAAGIGSSTATPIEYATVRFPVLDDKGKRYLKRLSGLLRGPPGTTVRVPRATAIRPIGPGEAVVQIGVEPATTEQINASFLEPLPAPARRMRVPTYVRVSEAQPGPPIDERQLSFFESVPEQLGLPIPPPKRLKKNPRSSYMAYRRRNPAYLDDYSAAGIGSNASAIDHITAMYSTGAPSRKFTKTQKRAAAAAKRKARYRMLHPQNADYYLPGGAPGSKRERKSQLRRARRSLGMRATPRRRKPQRRAAPRRGRGGRGISLAMLKRLLSAQRSRGASARRPKKRRGSKALSVWRRLGRDQYGRFLSASARRRRRPKRAKRRAPRRFYGTARHRSVSYVRRALGAARARRKKGANRLRATMNIRAGQLLAGRTIRRNPRRGASMSLANPRRRRRRNGGGRSVRVANPVRNPIGSFISVGKQSAIPMGAGAVGGAITGYLDARVLKDKHVVSVLSKAGIGILGALLLRKKPLVAMGFAGGCFGSLGYAFGLKMGGGLVAHSAASAALGLADMADSDPQVAAMLAGLADVVPDGMGDATGDYSDALGDVVQDY